MLAAITGLLNGWNTSLWQGVSDILLTWDPGYHLRRIRCYCLQSQTAQGKSSAWTHWSWNEDSTIFWNVGHDSHNDNSVTSQKTVPSAGSLLDRPHYEGRSGAGMIWLECPETLEDFNVTVPWQFTELQPCSYIIQASPSSATVHQTSHAVS